MKGILETHYKAEVKTKLNEVFKYENVMQIPKLEKVVINMGVGEAKENSKIIEHACKNLMDITGQKPIITKAKKSVSTFKIRQDMPIGCKVTLRGAMMYDFIKKLVDVVLPRVRDFRGLKDSFDGRGNYCFGIKDQTVFPEINYDEIDKIRGMDIAIGTTALTDKEAKTLLTFLGFPFAKPIN